MTPQRIVGYPLPQYQYSGKDAKKVERSYLAAVTQGYCQNYEPLAAFFAEAITRRLEAEAR